MECAHLPGFMPSPSIIPSEISKYPDDIVYPVFALDGASWNRKFITRVMCFNDVLDVEMLHDSLTRLFSIGDWRKLGGRAKLRHDGNLEIHVPRQFSTSRPAVRLTRVSVESDIKDHPIASQLPQATEGPSVQGLPADLSVLEADDEQPSRLDEVYNSDMPMFSLHVVTFNDATLVSLSFPHIVMDGFGSQAILTNWTRILAGKEDEVDRVLGADTDALLAAEQSFPTEEHEAWEAGSQHLAKSGFMWMAARLLWERLQQPLFEKRALYFPRATVDRLVQFAREEAAIKAKRDNNPSAFVSEADVIAAFIARCVTLSEGALRPVTIVGALNARFRFPELLPKVGTYIQNMVGGTYAVFSSRTMQASVGAIALEHRRTVVEQTTKPQICALLTRIRADIAADAIPPVFFGSTDSIHVVINNLTKMDLQRIVDFGPAVVRKGEPEETRVNPSGTVKMWYNNWRNARAPFVGSFYLLGRDWVGKGNYWCTGSFRPRTWKFIEEELASI